MSYLKPLFTILCFWCLFVTQNSSSKQENNLGVVRFPKVWTKKLTDGRTVAFANPLGFEVRRKKGAEPEEVIFAMKDLFTMRREDLNQPTAMISMLLVSTESSVFVALVRMSGSVPNNSQTSSRNSLPQIHARSSHTHRRRSDSSRQQIS
jgi:hypothetical protein